MAGEIRAMGLTLRVETDYPWSGDVTVRVLQGASGRIALRVPPWARGASFSYGPHDADARLQRVSRETAPGYAVAEGAGGRVTRSACTCR